MTSLSPGTASRAASLTAVYAKKNPQITVVFIYASLYSCAICSVRGNLTTTTKCTHSSVLLLVEFSLIYLYVEIQIQGKLNWRLSWNRLCKNVCQETAKTKVKDETYDVAVYNSNYHVIFVSRNNALSFVIEQFHFMIKNSIFHRFKNAPYYSY